MEYLFGNFEKFDSKTNELTIKVAFLTPESMQSLMEEIEQRRLKKIPLKPMRDSGTYKQQKKVFVLIKKRIEFSYRDDIKPVTLQRMRDMYDYVKDSYYPVRQFNLEGKDHYFKVSSMRDLDKDERHDLLERMVSDWSDLGIDTEE